MTLKQLEAFYWAATCSSFAMAAERVHLSVSSLSKRIAELEASLGQVLFDRAGHRAALTEAGTRLLPLAGALLQQADRLQQEMGSTAGLRGPYQGPVLWLRGGDSGYVTDEHAPAMRELFPRTRLVTIKHAGHWLHADQPQAVAATLQAFLDQLRPALGR